MNNENAVLQIKDVGFRVANNTILQHVGFNLSPGEFKLITGPSGCGKSTLLKIVASLLSPTEGTILFEGQDIASLSRKAIASRSLIASKRPCFWRHGFDNLIFPWQIRNKTPEPEKFIDDLARFGGEGDADQIHQ